MALSLHVSGSFQVPSTWKTYNYFTNIAFNFPNPTPDLVHQVKQSMIKVRLEQLQLPEPAMQAIILSVSKDSFLQSLKMDLNVIILQWITRNCGISILFKEFFLLTCCSDFLVFCSFQLNSTVLNIFVLISLLWF